MKKKKRKRDVKKMKERIKYRLKNGAARSLEFNETTRLSLILCEKSSSSARLRASYLPISTPTLSLAPFQESPKAGYYDFRAIALRASTSARVAALKNRHCWTQHELHCYWYIRRNTIYTWRGKILCSYERSDKQSSHHVRREKIEKSISQTVFANLHQ